MRSHTMLMRLGAGSVGVAMLLAGGAMLANAQTMSTTSTGAYTSSTTPGGTGATNTNAGGTANTTTTTGASGTSGGVTPGAPNTGAGGDAAANLALLAVAGIAALGGAAYIVRRGSAVTRM